MITAHLGLGSNLGNRLAFLQGGRDRLLDSYDIVLLRASSVFETAALGGPAGSPPFLNAVLEVETSLAARELLAACLATEQAFGRTRSEPAAPRTLDIDLLLYGDAVIDQGDLQVPHPHLCERAFVLAPLSEIAPDLVHPLRQQTIRALAAALPECAGLVPAQGSW